MQFYHYLAAIILGTTIGASTGIIMSEQKSKADVTELVALLTSALPQAIRNCLAVTDDMEYCNYVRYPVSGGGGGYRDTKVELLRYGNIPDYYPQKPLKETERALNKKQKISMLDDYEVVGLVPPKGSLYDFINHGTGVSDRKYKQKLYKRKIYTPNRRRALVALKLSDEAMRNCQAIIGKIKEHPNVGYISFTSTNEASTGYPCQGTYGKVRISHPSAVIVSKPADNKDSVNLYNLVNRLYATPYLDLSLTNGDYNNSSTKDTRFRYGYKKEIPEEPAFGFMPPSYPRGFKNHIFITYSF